MAYALAIDIGASSGRHILGTYQNGEICMEEIYRFENGIHEKDGYLSWDIETEQRFPHFANISGNVIIRHNHIEINFEWDNPLFENKVENNTVLEESPNCDLKHLCEEWLPNGINSFEPIPFSEIGIWKETE